ncbi:MAG: hypothetical protein Harvfovirus4_21 [Harvfovirus sp.]|uniref:Uncharacterized protein n=1 Tax=Harvfovirus sp. TaxID=2487768 RepID=A0A3G5A0E1_9VIRU|nr:MAG: hypothetical protein Harvfovirus4_21 [Harvfovirus sp.]
MSTDGGFWASAVAAINGVGAAPAPPAPAPPAPVARPLRVVPAAAPAGSPPALCVDCKKVPAWTDPKTGTASKFCGKMCETKYQCAAANAAAAAANAVAITTAAAAAAAASLAVTAKEAATRARAAADAAVRPEEKKVPIEATFIKVFSCDDIPQIMRDRHPELQASVQEGDISPAQMDKFMDEQNYAAVDIDGVIVENTGNLAFYVENLPGAVDCKIRGPTRVVKGVSYTQTEPNMVRFWNTRKANGMKIRFVTARGESAQADTEELLKAFGVVDPIVWCTGSTNKKGAYVKEKLPHLHGGLLFVLDDVDVALKSYVGEDAFSADRVVLMQYAMYATAPAPAPAPATAPVMHCAMFDPTPA